MNKIKFLLCSCAFLCIPGKKDVFSQGFQRTFGNSGSEIGTCIQSTQDGNYIISGTSTSFSNGYNDFYLLKIDTTGNVLWSKSYGTTYKEQNYFVSTCSDGGYILTGSTEKFTTGINTDLYLVKADSLGNLQWSQSIGGNKEDFGWYVSETNDGGYITVGGTKSFNTGDWDGYVVKTNSAGSLLWTKVIGGSSTDYFNGMSKTADGGYILTGVTNSNSFGSSDIWLVKLDSIGDSLWTRQYGKSTEDAGNSVIQTMDGGYMIAGDIHFSFGAGDHNASLVKTDSLGNLEWSKLYGSSPGSEIAWYARQNSDGSYLWGGSSAYYGNGGGGDVILSKTDSIGNLIWSKAYGGTAFDDFWLLAETISGGNAIVGSTAQNGQNILLIVTDSLGNSTCNTSVISPDVNSTVLLTKSGTEYRTGGSPLVHNTLTFPSTTVIQNPCSLVEVNEPETLTSFVTVFPNPFFKNTTVQIHNSSDTEKSFEVFDLLGNCLLRKKFNGNTSDITIETAAGIYIYQLRSLQGIIASGKLIVR